ncbi:hypothetical protein Bca101_058122 [Brassica carinata]
MFLLEIMRSISRDSYRFFPKTSVDAVALSSINQETENDGDVAPKHIGFLCS